MSLMGTARSHSVSIAPNWISSECRIIVSDQISRFTCATIHAFAYVCVSRNTCVRNPGASRGALSWGDPEVGRPRPEPEPRTKVMPPSTRVILSPFHASASLPRRNAAVAQSRSRKYADRIFIKLASRTEETEKESGHQQKNSTLKWIDWNGILFYSSIS